MPYCQACGKQINDNERICAACDEYNRALILQQNARTVAYTPARNPLKWIGLAVGAIVVIVIAIGAEQGVQEGVKAEITKDAGKTDDYARSGEVRVPKSAEKSDDAHSIEDVLAQDKTYNDVLQERMRDLQSKDIGGFDKLAEYLDEYVRAAENIDTRRCPRDFAEAYYRSITARSDVADAWRSHPEIPTGDDAQVRKIWKYLQGDSSGGDDELKGELLLWLIGMNAKMKQAQDSWQNMHAIAVRYGAA